MKKHCLLFLLTAIVLLLDGCWDNREINELGLVTAVGIDKGEGSKFAVTVQIANPSPGGGESGGAAKSVEWIGTAEGDSLFDAVRALGDVSSKRIMWAHNSVVIIGERLAKEGIIPVVDFFTHNPELRMKTVVVVSKGDAKAYIAANAGMDSPSGLSFVQLEGYRAYSAESVESHMLEISANLKNQYGNPLIAGIDFKQSTTKSQDGELKISTGNTVRIAGAAVFQRSKMLGWLTPGESLGIAWLLNQTQSTVVTIPVPAYGGKSVSVETMNVKSSIKSTVVNGTPQIAVEITGSGEIVEQDGSTDLDMEQAKKLLSALVSSKIKQDVENAISTVQKTYRVDVLGFASIVHSQNAAAWKDGLKYRWEMLFPQIPVTVSVKVGVHGSSLNQIPMHVG